MTSRLTWKRFVAAMGAALPSLVAQSSQADPPPPLALERLLETQLRSVEASLKSLCVDECGTALLGEPSHEPDTASARPVTRNSTLVTYGPSFMQKLRDRYGDSVTYFALAHEYGHHLDRTDGSPWTHELRADAFGGCALIREGLPLEPTLAWMRHEHFVELFDQVMGDPNSLHAILMRHIDAHPPWIRRIEAFRRGGEMCQAKDPTLLAFVAGILSAPDREEEKTRTALAGASASWRGVVAREREVTARFWGVQALPKMARF